MTVLELLGIIFLILLVGFGGLVLIMGLLIVFTEKRGSKITSRILLAFVTTLYGPLRYFFEKLRLDSRLIDRFIVQLYNTRQEDEFGKLDPHEVLVFLPQCLRSTDCPAKTTQEDGIVCQECGRCVIADIKKKLEPHGYRVFIAPGGTFVKRIVKRCKPKGAFGVACCPNLSEVSMGLVNEGITVQMEPLLRDGCVNTICDVEKVLSRLLPQPSGHKLT
jgi:hypothetical protein